MGKMCKNFSNKNCKINKLFKMKELDKIVLLKGLFNKTAPFSKKGHLDNPKQKVDVESPIIESYF